MKLLCNFYSPALLLYTYLHGANISKNDFKKQTQINRIDFNNDFLNTITFLYDLGIPSTVYKIYTHQHRMQKRINETHLIVLDLTLTPEQKNVFKLKNYNLYESLKDCLLSDEDFDMIEQERELYTLMRITCCDGLNTNDAFGELSD